MNDMLGYILTLLCFLIIIGWGLVFIYISLISAIRDRFIIYFMFFASGLSLIVMDVIWFLFFTNHPDPLFA